MQVHGELLGGELLAAVDAPEPVAHEDVVTLQWSTLSIRDAS